MIISWILDFGIFILRKSVAHLKVNNILNFQQGFFATINICYFISRNFGIG